MITLNSQTRILLFKRKHSSRHILGLILGLWRKPLDRCASIKILKDAIVYQKQHPPVDGYPFESSVDRNTVLTLNSLNNPEYKEEKNINFETDYVWKVEVNDPIKSLNLCSSGTTLLNQKLLLDLDYGTSAALRDFPIKLKTVEYPLVVAPWSHFFGGYYSFVTWVLAKLCHIEKARGEEI
jgi:hypothetical protein